MKEDYYVLKKIMKIEIKKNDTKRKTEECLEESEENMREGSMCYRSFSNVQFIFRKKNST